MEKTMKIRLLSDLHFEFYRNHALFNGPEADVLVIAGDLAVGAQACAEALNCAAEHYPNVVYVQGNHECYERISLQDFDKQLRPLIKPNVHFLSPGYVKINDVIFIGACLWTNFRKDRVAKLVCANKINDFRLIKGFDTDACAMQHTKEIVFIKEAYEKLPGKKVIVTHFLPAVECISEQYQGPDLINYYFANDYGDYISDLKDVPYWLFGHTHDNVNIAIGDVNLIANPYGYNKNPYYKEKVLDV